MHGPALQKRKVNDCCYKGRSHLLCELGSWWRWSHGGRPGTFDKVSCYVQIANKGGAAAKANIVQNYYTNYYVNHTLVPSALLAKQVYLWAFCAPSGMEPMTKRKVAEFYIMLECIRYSDKQHVGHHLKRNHAKDMSKIIAKSTRAIYNCCQASLGGGGGKGKGRKRLNICLGKWQRRWYIWILFLVILYPWTKWGNKIIFGSV